MRRKSQKTNTRSKMFKMPSKIMTVGALMSATANVVMVPGFSHAQTTGTAQAGVFESGGKVQLDVETMNTENPAFTAANPGIGSGSGSGSGSNAGIAADDRIVLPKGTKLTTLVKNDCLQAAREHEDRGGVKGEPLSGLAVQAYSSVTDREMTVDELKTEAEKDECVIGISNESTVTLDPIERDSHEEGGNASESADKSTESQAMSGETNKNKETEADATRTGAKANGDAGTLIAPNDPMFGEEKQLTAIQAPSAYDIFFEPVTGVRAPVVVAVIDTGVDYTHPDLAANMWTNAEGHHGYDFASQDNEPMDVGGHGTHVAGLLAAVRDNGIGVSGVMGSDAKIMSVRVIGGGGGTTTAIVNGIMYAVQNGANVISMSFGSTGKNSAYQYAIDKAVAAGVTVVASAGNSGDELTDSQWHSPSSYARDITGFMSVGAFDSESFTKPNFSNYSVSGYVDIGSPGSNGIFSTLKGGGYGKKAGTSMATPIVSGAAALTISFLRSRGYDAPPALVEDLIHESASVQPALQPFFTEGRALNLQQLAQLLNTRFPVK